MTLAENLVQVKMGRMGRMARVVAMVAGAVAVMAGGVTAGQFQGGSFIPPRPRISFTSVPAGGAGLVVGTVIDIRQVPVAGAKVQLRNLDTGSVLLVTEANENGEYSFPVLNSATYIVEMVLDGNEVVSISNAGILGRTEVMTTIIVLPGEWDPLRRMVTPLRDPGMFLGRSAITSITGQSLVMASDQGVKPADPGEAVSSNRPVP